MKSAIWILGFFLQGTLLLAQSEGNFIPDRPGVADTPYPAEKGSLHFETGLDWFETDLLREYHLPLLWVRVGLTNWLELRFADQIILAKEQELEYNFKVDAPLLGLKARLWQGEHTGLAVMGHTSMRREGQNRFFQSDIGLTMMHEWGGWSLNEHVWIIDGREGWRSNWAVCVGRALGDFGPFVEYFGARSLVGATSGLDGGTTWQVAPNIVLDASAGYLCKERWRQQGWFASLGISLRLANFAHPWQGNKPEALLR